MAQMPGSAAPAAASQTDRLAALEKSSADQAAAIAAAQSAGDNAWMLVSSALVLLMSGPGLALFYGGLVRRKNVLGTMMQTFAMMAVITVLWALVTYSLAFGEGNAFIGGLHNVFLRGVGLAPDPKYAATIPLQTFMVFQLMFAIITPALITGAFAERMKFSAMLTFMVLWAIFVYSPMAHMVWGKGGLLNASLGRTVSLPGFCRWHGGAHNLGRVGTGDCVIPGQTAGVPAGADAAALRGAKLYWGLPVVGGVVWIQCRLGFERRHTGDLGIRGDALRSRRGSHWLERRGVDARWAVYGAGCDLGGGGRAGGDYTGFRLRNPDLRFVDRPDRRSILLPDGGEG